MHEVSGFLGSAVMAYLRGAALSFEQITYIRAYCRQWVERGAWQGVEVRVLLSDVDTIVDRPTITAWIRRAQDLGMDPL